VRELIKQVPELQRVRHESRTRDRNSSFVQPFLGSACSTESCVPIHPRTTSVDADASTGYRPTQTGGTAQRASEGGGWRVAVENRWSASFSEKLFLSKLRNPRQQVTQYELAAGVNHKLTFCAHLGSSIHAVKSELTVSSGGQK